MPFFITAILNCVLILPLWERASVLLKETWTSTQVTQNVWWLSLVRPRLSKPMVTCLTLISTFKSWTTGLRRKRPISVSMVTCMCQVLGWKGKTLFLNPGSISQPRGTIRECLYARVEIDDSYFKVDFWHETMRCIQAYPRSLADDCQGSLRLSCWGKRKLFDSCWRNLAVLIDTHNADHATLLLSQMTYTRVPVVTDEKQFVGTIGLRDIMAYQMEHDLSQEIMADTDIVHMTKNGRSGCFAWFYHYGGLAQAGRWVLLAGCGCVWYFQGIITHQVYPQGSQCPLAWL